MRLANDGQEATPAPARGSSRAGAKHPRLFMPGLRSCCRSRFRPHHPLRGRPKNHRRLQLDVGCTVCSSCFLPHLPLFALLGVRHHPRHRPPFLPGPESSRFHPGTRKARNCPPSPRRVSLEEDVACREPGLLLCWCHLRKMRVQDRDESLNRLAQNVGQPLVRPSSSRPVT